MGRSLLPLLGFTLLAGCSYDWTVQSARGGVDGGAEAEAGPGLDSGSMDAPLADTGPDASIMDSTAVEAEAGPDCATLTAQLQAAKQAALACTSTVMACMFTVTDECGCHVAVGTQNSTAANAFGTAVASFDSAHCDKTSLCQGSCTPPPQICLLDGGTTGGCVQ